ncbi:MAG: glycine--tRNA ligase subunit beta [Acetobacter sp.]|nr:glycine--tRNA ligase subunit beta [Acetobacter sp.]
MPELLIELFSEEIPASMQQQAGENLLRLLTEAINLLHPTHGTAYTGPRRIAASLTVAAEVPSRTLSERGPRENAPPQALEGFIRKHGVTQEDLTLKEGFWWLKRQTPAVSASQYIASVLPDLLYRFPWSKSMRWGKGSSFTWIRPLRRILCLLDGQIVPFSLARHDDNGHGLQASHQTEGHRFLSTGSLTVNSTEHWKQTLQKHYVMVDAHKRRQAIVEGLQTLASHHGLTVVEDVKLVEEVAGLVEWPTSFIGQIDPLFMDLPPEVMQVSMRVNQRYFTLRDTKGNVAPYFAFIANILPSDKGTLVIKGNERVLRARFADARHFWDLDRKQTLESRLPILERITFHARIGSQGERVRRVARLAKLIAPMLHTSATICERAALLSKADLSTNMVSEFPELQGIIGSYYATHDGEHAEVAQALREQYMPQGPADCVPKAPVSLSLGLADRIDLLTAFFAAGEKPSGSGDPFALRRAALGVIRLIRENSLRLNLTQLLRHAAENLPASLRKSFNLTVLAQFIIERLRVQLRSEGIRHDYLTAVFNNTTEIDIVQLLARTQALQAMLETEEGVNLLAATRRANNILTIESKKDGPYQGMVNPSLFQQKEEQALFTQLEHITPEIERAFHEERFTEAMHKIASLRPMLDDFFSAVTVNASDTALRLNRLYLLHRIVDITHLIADFSQIEG